LGEIITLIRAYNVFHGFIQALLFVSGPTFPIERKKGVEKAFLIQDADEFVVFVVV